MNYRRGRGSLKNGSRSHPCAQFIRFTEEENKRLNKLIRKRGLTVQAFGHAAIIRAINEADLGKKADGEIEREEPRRETPPLGLGIRDRLRESSEDDDYDDRRSESVPSTNSSASAPVLAQARTIDNEIMSLARTVVGSPKSARKDVLRAASQSIARGRTLEEAVRLADDLDAAIKRLDDVPQTALERVRARAGR